jgi:hypothetical protein
MGTVMSAVKHAAVEIRKRVGSESRRFLSLVLATLREIGDENAYERHLAAHGVSHSAEEWRRFCDERWVANSKRARCC